MSAIVPPPRPRRTEVYGDRMILSDLVGSWAGTNGFRLMPGDPLAEFPATATVTPYAGGHLTAVAYTWRHPDDGPQDGLIVAGVGTALWADSWHQQPEPMTLPGADGGYQGEYGDGFGWRICFDTSDAEVLRMRMDNVPASGPYPVMVMDLHRA